MERSARLQLALYNNGTQLPALVFFNLQHASKQPWLRPQKRERESYCKTLKRTWLTSTFEPEFENSKTVTVIKRPLHTMPFNTEQNRTQNNTEAKNQFVDGLEITGHLQCFHSLADGQLQGYTTMPVSIGRDYNNSTTKRHQTTAKKRNTAIPNSRQ